MRSNTAGTKSRQPRGETLFLGLCLGAVMQCLKQQTLPVLTNTTVKNRGSPHPPSDFSPLLQTQFLRVLCKNGSWDPVSDRIHLSFPLLAVTQNV